MPSTWTKLSDKPRDRGLYRSEAGTIRVLYQSREVVDGRPRTVQRAKAFPRGAYVITDPVTLATKRVTEEAAARSFKALEDQGRRAGRTRDVSAEGTTLGEYFERWIGLPSRRTGTTRRPTTIARTRAAYDKHIAPAFGEVPIRSITVADVETWHAGLTGDRNKAMRTLRAILAGAVRSKIVAVNVAAEADIRAQDRVRPVQQQDIFTDDEMGRLLEAIDDRYRLAIELLGYGLRIGEVFGLKRNRVNLKADVKVDWQITEAGSLVEGPPKTHNGIRVLPLGVIPGFADRLQDHIGKYAQPEADGFVFTSENGTAPVWPSNFRDRAFYPALERAGLRRVTPHMLRHRCASMLVDLGYSVEQVAHWLGDTPATVAKVYAHLFDDTNRKIAEGLAARLGS
jgi:integrase